MRVKKSKILYDSITRLLRRRAHGNIRRMLLKSHPSEIASVVRQFPTEEAILLMEEIRDSDVEAKTFSELESAFLGSYLSARDDKVHMAEVLQKLPDDEAAALLADLPSLLVQEILSLMKGSTQAEVNEILQYAENSCGRIMAVNVTPLNQDSTAAQAIGHIQSQPHTESLFYLYVTDEFGTLVGVVSLKQLLQVEGRRSLKEFMVREVVKVNVYDSQVKAADCIEEYNFVSLPVVDDSGKFMGMVTVDDVIDVIREEAQDEVLEMAGVEPEALEDFSFWRALSARGFWYALLYLGGILSSELILHFFANFSDRIFVLCFAPLAMRLGGSIAFQGMTFVNQGIFNTGMDRGRATQALWGQNVVTLTMGLALSVAVSCYIFFRFDHFDYIAIIMGLSLFFVAVVSALVGIILPFLFRFLRLDPLRASTRFVHFLMDGVSLVIFFKFSLKFW
jgi:magnesium transporter